MPTIIVYRDTLGVRSESFIQRQYSAFKTLQPLYVGVKRAALAPKDAVILAAPSLFGLVRRFTFRHMGKMPDRLKRLIRKQKPVLIHAQFGLGGALALPIATQMGLPLVVTFHGGDATKDKHYKARPLLPTIFQRRRAAMVEKAAAILCVSHFVRNALITRGFPAGKLETHYLGIDIPQNVVLPPTGVSSSVLFVGRLVEKKGVDTLIDAMAIAQKDDPALELIVIGDGPLRRDLEKRAATAGIKARFDGWQGEKDVRIAMRRALVLAVPSKAAGGGDSEGLPTVIMEAMALGVPVIATNHAGIPEIVSNGVTGLLTPEDDPAALAEAILTIRRNPELAGRLRGEAFADVRARFDAKRQSAMLEQRLLEIAAKAA